MEHRAARLCQRRGCVSAVFQQHSKMEDSKTATVLLFRCSHVSEDSNVRQMKASRDASQNHRVPKLKSSARHSDDESY